MYRQARSSVARSPHDIPKPAVSLQVNAVRRVPDTRVLVFGNVNSTRIPWEDPETGKGGLQRIVNVSSIPRGPGKLDDAVRIIVDLPPGSGKGPVVSPHLARYGVQSAPLYRGLLNLAYQRFDPGRTRFPVRGGKHWLQVEDPERYPTIANDLLIELFYPTSSQKARRNLASRARKDLDRLVKDGEARIVKGRLMPPKPRE